MNKQEKDILNTIRKDGYLNQRELAKKSGYSLGIVNQVITKLSEDGYLTEDYHLSLKAQNMFREMKPGRAVILAAGFGMRMVPINTSVSKGLLEVKGEVLIERTIRQLHEVGITEIYIVVGFMKEQYEYLMDKYHVKLIVNSEYATKNNLHSLRLAAKYLENAYIIPCDIWCRENPFHDCEPYSWYMLSNQTKQDAEVRVNRKWEIVRTNKEEMGNRMIGISYISKRDSKQLCDRIDKLCENPLFDNVFWEEALFVEDKMFIWPNVVAADSCVEINTYEQLRDVDSASDHLQSEAIEVICEALGILSEDVTDITVLKKGMTNRSFLFQARGKKYIMRIPGEGTDQLINRREEAEVYRVICDKKICDDIAYMNPENGYKITEYLENARVCDPNDESDLRRCMDKLREFHGQKLVVDHEFNLWKQIDFYESLWDGKPSAYKDYEQTKANVLTLKEYIERNVIDKCLTHIDAVPDNFLFAGEEIRLIDWEYAGMQDPHVDIAMFCIYSLYEREQIDRLIDIYFCDNCNPETRIKIYCYVAVCGLLWSNWCEYKRNLGIEFGEYSLRQYRYAKEYYRIATELLKGV